MSCASSSLDLLPWPQINLIPPNTTLLVFLNVCCSGRLLCTLGSPFSTSLCPKIRAHGPHQKLPCLSSSGHLLDHRVPQAAFTHLLKLPAPDQQPPPGPSTPVCSNQSRLCSCKPRWGSPSILTLVKRGRLLFFFFWPFHVAHTLVNHAPPPFPSAGCRGKDGVMATQEKKRVTSLVIQWLRLHAPNAGGPVSIPGQGTRSHKQQLSPSAAKINK